MMGGQAWNQTQVFSSLPDSHCPYVQAHRQRLQNQLEIWKMPNSIHKRPSESTRVNVQIVFGAITFVNWQCASERSELSPLFCNSCMGDKIEFVKKLRPKGWDCKMFVARSQTLPSFAWTICHCVKTNLVCSGNQASEKRPRWTCLKTDHLTPEVFFGSLVAFVGGFYMYFWWLFCRCLNWPCK